MAKKNDINTKEEEKVLQNTENTENAADIKEENTEAQKKDEATPEDGTKEEPAIEEHKEEIPEEKEEVTTEEETVEKPESDIEEMKAEKEEEEPKKEEVKQKSLPVKVHNYHFVHNWNGQAY